MTRYADPERCPDCLAPMPYGSLTCPQCGLHLEGPLAAGLFQTLTDADRLLDQLRERSSAPSLMTAAGPALPTPAGEVPAPPSAGAGAELLGGWTAEDQSRRQHHGMSQASVPKILLGLGAVCLLIAALVFLAVTWSAMGVAGRTATLVGFTVVAAALSTWAARRELRAAAESLSVVALGLLAFDLFGARDSGWFGDIGTPAFLVLLGSCLVGAGAAAALLARRTAVGALTAPEVVAVLGLGAAGSGLTGTSWLAWSAAITLVVVVAAGAAYGAHRVRLHLLTGGAVVIGVVAWLALVLSSVDRAVSYPSLRELWLEAEVWPLLTAALLVGSAALLRQLPHPVRVAALAVAEVVLASTVLVPFTDETVTAATTAGATLTTLACVALWFTPVRWAFATGLAVALGGLWMALTALTLLGIAVGRGLDAGSRTWLGSLETVLPAREVDRYTLAPWLLPVAVVVAVAAAILLAHSLLPADRLAGRTTWSAVLAALTAGTVVATVALYPVPVWLIVAMLLLSGAGLVWWALGWTLGSAAAWEPHGQRWPALALGAGFLAAALAVGLHTQWLSLAALLVGLLATLATHLRWPIIEVSALAGFLASTLLAAAAWTVGDLAGADGTWVTVAGLLLLAVVVLAMPYLDGPVRVAEPATLSRLGLEAGALAGAFALTLAGLDSAEAVRAPTWLAVFLTLSGATAAAMALLRADRRRAGWLGGALLAAASWVRLWDIGVEDPEAYTLPTALALLVVGVLHLRRTPTESTMTALSPGLGLALVPSLIWVVADPVTLRSALLGLACLALVLGGVRIRWSAPVVYGAVVGAVVVLRHATPVAEAVPRWGLIAAAGALLIATGITWERRLHEARALAGYVRSLR